MEKYNYYSAMEEDIREYINDNDWPVSNYDNIDDATEALNDELWAEDSITGNGAFYYDTEEKCEEYICHNLNLLFTALYEFGEFDAYTFNIIKGHFCNGDFARWADCAIRCYLLNECIYNVLQEGDYYDTNK